MLARRFFLFALLLAVGCHSAANNPAPAPQPQPAVQDVTSGVDTHSAQPTRAALPVVVAFGDSLTAGRGLDAGQSYPDFLQSDLERDGYRVRVVNLGVSGDTTKDGLARVQDALRLHPVVAIVAFGGNDGLRGVAVTVMEKNMSAILDQFARANVPVVLGGITLPPNYGAAYVQGFNGVYPRLAAEYHAPLLPFMLQGVWDQPGMMQEDGVHPTAPGAKIVAQNFLPLVEPLLKKN